MVVDHQLGLVQVVSLFWLKDPRFRRTQQWVIRGFQTAGGTIRRGEWQAGG